MNRTLDYTRERMARWAYQLRATDTMPFMADLDQFEAAVREDQRRIERDLAEVRKTIGADE